MIFILTLILTIFSTLRYFLDILLFLFKVKLIFLKILFLILFVFIIRYIHLYPYKQKLKLSYLRKLKYESHLKYKINDDTELDISINIVFLYFLVFVILLLIFRLNNKSRFLNLYFYIQQITSLIEITPKLIIILNILLIITGVILYIFILSSIIKYIKIHIFKLYYYVFLNLYNTNKKKIILLDLRSYLNIHHYTVVFNTTLLPKITKCLNMENGFVERIIFIHCDSLKFIIHRLILILIIIYDILYNNMILTHMFKILPYILIYELWVKLSIFLMGVNFDYDWIIRQLLYGKVTSLEYDKECLYLDDIPYEKKVLNEIITGYARNGFVDKYFLPQDPIKEGLYDLFKFWKKITIIPIIKQLSKYKTIDILCFIVVIILLCR
jgi:hypothetical protein